MPEDKLFQKTPLQIFQTLTKIHSKNPEAVTGSLLAKATKLLFTLETAPGGPYAISGEEPTIELNLAIRNFLRTQTVVLPDLDNFLLEKGIKPDKEKQPIKKTDEYQSAIYRHICRKSYEAVRALPGALRNLANEKIREMITSDSNGEILLLPYFFKLFLGNLGTKISPDIIYKLGTASLWLWLSVAIDDDLLDNQTSIKNLPLANWAEREFVMAVTSTKTSPEYLRLFRKIMNHHNYSQVWEMKYARYQENTIPLSAKIYSRSSVLSRKSLSHAIIPLYLLDQMKAKQSDSKNIKLFFTYYLSARQLHDDLSDFEEDLENNRITAANVSAIVDRQNKSLEELRDNFENKTVTQLAKQIITYTNLADRYLREVKIIKHPEYLMQFVRPLRLGAEQIIGEKRKERDFLEALEKD
jgi:hypothetical protein